MLWSQLDGIVWSNEVWGTVAEVYFIGLLSFSTNIFHAKIPVSNIIKFIQNENVPSKKLVKINSIPQFYSFCLLVASNTIAVWSQSHMSLLFSYHFDIGLCMQISTVKWQ